MNPSPLDETSTKGLGIFRQAEFRIHQRRPSIEPFVIKKLKKRAVELAKQTASSPCPLCFVVDFEATTQGLCVFDDPKPYIAQQSTLPNDKKLILIVDKDGREVSCLVEHWDEADNRDPVWAAKVSEENQAVVFHVFGHTLIIYESGVPMEELFDVWHPRYPFSAKSDRHRPADEYAQLIRRHFDDCVQYHRVVVYWKDRSKRIFVGGPEKVFQRHLWWYLDEFTLDHREVSMEHPPGGLTDRTDIWIETINDEHYLLEIKWLGRSTSGTYDAERAKEGARQTIEYLKRFPRITRAALVMYDGRTKDEEIPWTESESHPKLDRSLRLYIESKTASEVAKKP